MQEKDAVSAVNRFQLLKICLELGMTNAAIEALTRPMRGKPDSEKEEMAAQLIRELLDDQLIDESAIETDNPITF